jgi:hypothetical protein
MVVRASCQLVVIGVFFLSLSPHLGAALNAEEERPFDRFPEPLERLSCNIADLEKSGHLALTKVEYGRTAMVRDDAVIWTLKVVKPITCRHVIMLLRHLRDVRFYATPQGTVQETHWTLLYYSARIPLGAVNRQVLSVDEQFQIWVPINAVEIRRITSRGADTVVFSELKR